MKNILTASTGAISALLFIGIVVWGTFKVTEVRAEMVYESEIAFLAKQIEQAEIDRMIVDANAQLEAEKILLARAFYGEYREGTAEERALAWEMQFSAIYNRLEYGDDWSGDFTETMKWGCEAGACQINSLPFVGPEALLTDIGKEALAKADELIEAMHFGPYKPLHSGHSWATAAAVVSNAYFAGKCQVAEGPGHLYFGDCPDT